MRTFRKERVASIIREVIGEALGHRLHDPRVAPLTTVTRVEMTRDLQVARVYLSVQGDGALERRTLRAVRHASGYFRKMVAASISLRQCPELRFEIDEGAKQARETLLLLGENLRRNPSLAAPEETAGEHVSAEEELDPSSDEGHEETDEDGSQ